MKKVLLFLLLSSITPIFSQNPSEEYNFIQRFILSTVQIPFMAKVDNVQGKVAIRITMGGEGKPNQYEITQFLRPDCHKEALRVVKLLNNKLLTDNLNGKKKILIEVPFFNPKVIFFRRA